MKTTLNHLFQHNTLTYQQSKDVLINVANGQYTESEIAAFLAVFLMRSIKVEELTGFRDALLDLCVQVDFSDFETVDLCGTGGDGKNTFNISTIASFVVAGAGIKVAKHGNYGVSSSCGSSNLLEYLGYEFSRNENVLKSQLDKAGICFLHAPLFHLAMKNVAPVRRNLGIKTFFNMLGPMVNPSMPKSQLIGVYSLELLRLYHYLYQQTDKNYIIVHAMDGYDEVSLTSEMKIVTNKSEEIVCPKDLGFFKLNSDELYGGATVSEAAEIFTNIIEGNGTEAQNNVVIINAALAIKATDQSKTLAQCIDEAKASLFGKKALETLKKLLS